MSPGPPRLGGGPSVRKNLGSLTADRYSWGCRASAAWTAVVPAFGAPATKKSGRAMGSPQGSLRLPTRRLMFNPPLTGTILRRYDRRCAPPLFIVAGRVRQRHGPAATLAGALAARVVLLAALPALAAVGHVPAIVPLAAFRGVMFAWSFLSVASPGLTGQLAPARREITRARSTPPAAWPGSPARSSAGSPRASGATRPRSAPGPGPSWRACPSSPPRCCVSRALPGRRRGTAFPRRSLLRRSPPASPFPLDCPGGTAPVGRAPALDPGPPLAHALLHGVAHELRLVVQLQLDQGVLDVVLDGPGRQHEQACDLRVRHALGHQPEHLGLPLGELRRGHGASRRGASARGGRGLAATGGQPPVLAQDQPGQTGREHGPAGGGGPHRLHHLAELRRLDQVAGRARGHGVED